MNGSLTVEGIVDYIYTDYRRAKDPFGRVSFGLRPRGGLEGGPGVHAVYF